jgi:hypothetical protein
MRVQNSMPPFDHSIVAGKGGTAGVGLVEA